LQDRYGSVPRPVHNLLDYADLKLAAANLWIRSIERKEDAVELQFHNQTGVEPERLMNFIQSNPGTQFTPSGLLRLRVRSPKDVLPQVQTALGQLQGPLHG
jgi:transcription-repair coupling factor (superfamily II helicase)